MNKLPQNSDIFSFKKLVADFNAKRDKEKLSTKKLPTIIEEELDTAPEQTSNSPSQAIKPQECNSFLKIPENFQLRRT